MGSYRAGPAPSVAVLSASCVNVCCLIRVLAHVLCVCRTTAGLGGVVAPGVRDETHDFAMEGYRMRRDDLQYVAERVQSFKDGIPAYPAGTFSVSGAGSMLACG